MNTLNTSLITAPICPLRNNNNNISNITGYIGIHRPPIKYLCSSQRYSPIQIIPNHQQQQQQPIILIYYQ